MDFYLQAGVLLCKNMNTKICLQCGKEFERPKKRDIKKWEKQKYCSKKCSYNSTTKHGFLIGKGNNHLPKTYVTWQSMKQRCYNKKHEAYRRYSDRGITVCDRWMGADGFTNFLADMGVRPENKTLDRINNDGNYEPSNCRWATSKQQANNTQRSLDNKTLFYNGIEYPKRYIIQKLSKELNVDNNKLRKIVKIKSLDDAVAELLKEKMKHNEEKVKEIRIIKTFKDGRYIKRNKLIIELRLKYKTLNCIGEKLGLTRERVRQIINEVIKFDKKAQL